MAAQSGPQVDLTWADNSADETGFVIERRIGPGAWGQVGSVGANVASFTDSPVTPSTTYDYRVAAVKGALQSGWSNVVTVVVPAVPAAPAAVVATGTNGSISVTFRDNANNETGFLVERNVDGVGWFAFTTLPARTGNGRSVTFIDATVQPEHSYQYRVAAANGVVLSAFATSNAVSTPPNAPSALAGDAVRNGQNDRVTLTWTDNSAIETGFRIQRATNAAFTVNQQSWTVGANAITFAQNVARNRTFYYRVRALSPNGFSAWSNVITVVTP